MKDKLESILKSKELSEVTQETIESLIDEKISNEIISAVPVLRLLSSAVKIHQSISDKIFLKKAMHVIFETKDVNWKQRMDLVQSLENNKQSGVEKIMMEVDRMSSLNRCIVFGRLLKLRALKKIDFNEFDRLTHVIQNAYLEDLVFVFNFKSSPYLEYNGFEHSRLLALGVIYEKTEQSKLKFGVSKNQMSDKKRVSGGQVSRNVYLTEIGEVIHKYHWELFEGIQF